MRSCRVRSLASLLPLAVASILAHAQTSVPYVGCPGDGQTGPYSAVKGSPKTVNLAPETADKLARYEYKGDAGQIGTLGPRGWNCFVTIGSNGETLYIAPEALDSGKILAIRIPAVAVPLAEITVMSDVSWPSTRRFHALNRSTFLESVH